MENEKKKDLRFAIGLSTCLINCLLVCFCFNLICVWLVLSQLFWCFLFFLFFLFFWSMFNIVCECLFCYFVILLICFFQLCSFDIDGCVGFCISCSIEVYNYLVNKKYHWFLIALFFVCVFCFVSILFVCANVSLFFLYFVTHMLLVYINITSN